MVDRGFTAVGGGWFIVRFGSSVYGVVRAKSLGRAVVSFNLSGSRRLARLLHDQPNGRLMREGGHQSTGGAAVHWPKKIETGLTCQAVEEGQQSWAS
jgi:hypothetical protein